jgi:hypothetical protein
MKNRTAITAGLCRLLRLGLSRAAVCERLKIHYNTFHNWFMADVKFCEAIKSAEAEFVEDQVNIVHQAARTPNLSTGQVPWQAAAWLLERRRPEEYGRNSVLTAEQFVQAALENLGLMIRDNPEAQKQFQALQETIGKDLAARKERKALKATQAGA